MLAYRAEKGQIFLLEFIHYVQIPWPDLSA